MGYGWNIGTSNTNGLGYYYYKEGETIYAGPQVRLAGVVQPAETIMLGDIEVDYQYNFSYLRWPAMPSPHFEGANYAFVDGHVKWFETEALMSQSRLFTIAAD